MPKFFLNRYYQKIKLIIDKKRSGKNGPVSNAKGIIQNNRLEKFIKLLLIDIILLTFSVFFHC